MYVSASIVVAAIRNGDDSVARRHPNDPLNSVEAIVRLLADRVSPAAQRAARFLLEGMKGVPWKVLRGIPVSDRDPTPHALIELRGTQYHLRVDGRQCVWDITKVVQGQTVRVAGSLPWSAPGT